MDSEVRQTRELVDWYNTAVRSFLEKTVPEGKIAEFDKDRDLLSKVARVGDADVAVCFLGPSGIGKSTIINAVVGGSQSVVPSGGVGPLTAQALVVRSRPTRRLEVEYHGRVRILRTVFGLQQMFKAELGNVENQETLIGLEEVAEDELPEDAEAVTTDEDIEAEPDANAGRQERREQFRRSAQLLVTGSQDDDRELCYLLDALTEAAGGKRVWGTEPDPADTARLEGIRRALSLAKEGSTFVLDGAEPDEVFQQSLHEHATGYLAPLIKNLTLDWPSSELTNDITLVDLPGVGVVRDVHADVTRKWIREKAQALVLVVDHRGMTEPLADALRRSEFLNSLLYSSDEPEDDPIVIVAVTRIDDVANDKYRQDHSKKKYEHFLDACEEVKGRLKNELQRRLEEIWLNDQGVSEARRQVVRNLLATLQVHPLSAPEYVRLIADDEDDRSFLKQLDQTGIPVLIESLKKLAEGRREKATARLRERASVFHERLVTTLRLVEAQWEGEGRAEEEAARLRRDLEDFIQPLREELANRQGGYRTFLKKTVPRRVEDLIAAAKAKASKDIDRYLARLWQTHWGTLRASVRRGGRYSGASDINLPTEFALRFEEPIAEVWGKEILKDVRKETKEYADDCVALVEQVAEWALAQGARVQPRVIEAQRDAIRADAKKLQSVGREMVKEMRDEAKSQLVNAIEGPIKLECDKFVRKNLDVGPGVKLRILELYESLADRVTEAAEEPAKRILLRLYREVEKEILEAFADRQNPLNSIFDAIVTSQQKYLERSDAQKRRRILGELKSLWADMPGPQQAEAVTQGEAQEHAV
ncbi:MAG TPA: dynamin family protein [Pyrinomonadaceae bacterium]|nr:dynamin family protein [Pyrinomonadaceae bacterium]